MHCYLGVKFRLQGQIYYFCAQEDAANAQVQDWVLVTTDEGPGLANVAVVRKEPPLDLSQDEIKSVERLACAQDFQTQAQNDELRKEAMAYCREKIRELGLDMKLVDVEVRFDQSKIVFYFTAPARIDFRELVKILVTKHRTRIELRQIGVRHEAQILGGIGNCGRVCCCHQFMRKFEPVTIKMAKEQQLFLNPSKISGACGRLLCCLNFEREQYTDFQRRCPKIGKWYETSRGEVKVLRANMFRDSLIVDAGEGEREVTLAEWNDLLLGKNGSEVDHVFENTSGNNRALRMKNSGPKTGKTQEPEVPAQENASQCNPGPKAESDPTPEQEEQETRTPPQSKAGSTRNGKAKAGPRAFKGKGKKKKQ
ncbi:MAG: regulatory iron-sulfur-containing complex subunit RicT [Desulfovermiculus sp.]|nr:regulatory iron-sulfur-containing complex subunit RicT [Desulfovermiculus sp.]